MAGRGPGSDAQDHVEISPVVSYLRHVLGFYVDIELIGQRLNGCTKKLMDSKDGFFFFALERVTHKKKCRP